MVDLLEISDKNLKEAHRIIEELRIYEIWKEPDSVCNLVGSVKTGLLLEHLDVDFHVYSDDFSISRSFEAIARISENHRIKDVVYRNLLDAEDMCLEWHLTYRADDGRLWTLDIIHIKNESVYAGVIEKVTCKIEAALTPELKENVLRLKWELSRKGKSVPGIDIYEAVFGQNISTYEDFDKWMISRKRDDISLWMPEI